MDLSIFRIKLATTTQQLADAGREAVADGTTASTSRDGRGDALRQLLDEAQPWDAVTGGNGASSICHDP